MHSYGGNIDYRGVLQKYQLFPQFFRIMDGRPCIFFIQVPFVYYKDNSFPCFVSVAYDFFILFGNAFDSIDDHQYDIRAVNRPKRADDTVFFDQFFYFSLAAHTCRIYKQEPLSVFHYRGIDGIPCSARHVADDGSVLPYQRVKNRRFAHIRTPDESYFDFVFIFIIKLGNGLPYLIHKSIQHVAQSQMICCRNGDRFAQSQIIEFKNFHFLLK